MKVSGRQRTDLEHQYRKLLWNFYSATYTATEITSANLGFKDKIRKIYDLILNRHISIVIRENNSYETAWKVNEYANAMRMVAESTPDSHGKIGHLRGLIRRERKLRVRKRDGHIKMKDKAVVEMLEKIMHNTKLLMNGENILKTKECRFIDREEELYCRTVIAHGYTYCKEHYDTKKASEE